jgi:PAS domain S-box-containing protein
VDLPDLAPSNKKDIIRILHVDDDPSLQVISKQILLEMDNFEVDHACCVDEALRKLAVGHYDVVVSDYEMPQKDGICFLKLLKEQNNEIPFILFTGKGREEVAIKALNLGVHGYYTKQGSTETVYGELAHGIRLAAERAKAKTALEESEKRYRTLMEQAAEAIFVHDPNGQVIDVNQLGCKNLGYTREELLSMNIVDFAPNATKNGQGGIFWPKVLAGQSLTFGSYQKRKDKSLFPIEVTIGPITIGKETLVLALTRDITKQMKAEETLKSTKEYLDNLLDCGNNGPIVIWDNEKRINLFNNAFESFTGLKSLDVLGRRIDVLLPPSLKTELLQTIEKASLGKKWQSMEMPILCKNGKTRVALFNSSNIKDENGNITATIVHCEQNINKSGETETKLSESEEKYRRLFEVALDAIFVADAETGILVDCNRAACELVGREKTEIVGAHQQILHPPKESEGEFSKTFQGHLREKEGQVLESKVITKSGEIKNVEIKANMFILGNKALMRGSFRDVTERKKAEEALKDAKNRFSSLFLAMNEGFCLHELVYNDFGKAVDYTILDVNPAYELIIGLKKKEVVGRKASEIYGTNDGIIYKSG